MGIYSECVVMEQAPTEQAQVPTEAAKVPSEYTVNVETLLTNKVPTKRIATLSKMKDGELFVDIVLVLPFRKIKHAVLERFFVMPRKKTGTKEFRGEGKKALCYLMNTLVNEVDKDKKLDIKTVVEVEAEASMSPDDPTSTEPTKDFDTLLKEFPNAKGYLDPPNVPKNVLVPTGKMNAFTGKPISERQTIYVPGPPYSDEEVVARKARLEKTIPQNRKLVKYYETYGFDVVPEKDYGYKTKMTGTVEKILNACKPAGAARKTTRRRRRTQRTRRHRNRGF